MQNNNEREQTSNPVLAWLARHINAHRFLWLLSLACFLIAWNRGILLMYGLLSMILALQAISWLLPWLAVRSVTISRSQHGPAQAGKYITLDYQLNVPSTRYHIALKENLPCSINQSGQTHFLPSINNGTTFSADIRCNRRGVFNVTDIEISSGWPFGFVDLSVTLKTPSCELVVMPRTFSIAQLPMLRSNISAVDGYNQTAQSSQQNEFAGVREYRAGDSLKHIHWAASARHQELIVREYDSHDRPHFLVVLDARPEVDVGEAPYSSFECAVSIAASILEYAIEKQLGLYLIAAGNQPLAISISTGCRNSHEYLEQLAYLKADGSTPYTQVIEQAFLNHGEINTLITIQNQNESLSLPQQMSGHLDIRLQEESFIYPIRPFHEGWTTHSTNHKSLHVCRSSDLKALFQT
jgi:uncharacterized protein (DUF58 family)